MPVSTLKIDRSFVRNVPEDAGAAAVVKAIIQLARNLGMQPLAEGIEHEGQRRFLLDHGCRLGQGYHFSRPVDAAAIEAIYRR
jgi:diguanylate cyclase